MTTDDLRHSTPHDAGVDARGISAFLDALDADPDIRPHGLIVLRGGAVIAEGWWSPYDPDGVQLLYSLSKSFTATAAGLARAEGLLDLDATVLSYFPELEAEITDPRTRRMTVRNIASMASGHAAETVDRAAANDPTNLVRGFLMIPPDAEPGTLFAYNQPCTYTLAAIVQRQTGQSLVDYLRPRLFEPLGIGEAFWMEEPAGRNLGFSGLHATTDAVARLGQLYLQGGRWGEQQLLDADWVAEASRVQVPNAEEGPDWRQGYGLQFWMSRHGYRGDGAYGQFCLVLPEHDAVIALTSETVQMQRVLDLVWRHILPAIEAGSSDPSADAELAGRLSSLALPVVAGAPAPEDADRWDGAVFAVDPVEDVAPFVSGSADRAPSQVRVSREADGWRLAVTDEHGTIETPIGFGDWVADREAPVPVAASAGWMSDGGLEAEILFLDTPHSMRVVCSDSGTASVRWNTVPLHSTDVHAQHHP
ncbi:serine hydrolase [Homoserinibacter sp. GY 40078]|uniref:serine hydrolase domain-containing protein n=1 Tax=Homoserinibacter sp. GY 40078 TaxID=2603275 RepID=UPI0011C72199|nr:serine hydrolase domain-containing protein [Homoserinibacter sp. GY 40078]TXK19236.1 beta-lactamase family protein [Homoserinibacter sp. GY 40078]